MLTGVVMLLCAQNTDFQALLKHQNVTDYDVVILLMLGPQMTRHNLMEGLERNIQRFFSSSAGAGQHRAGDQDGRAFELEPLCWDAEVPWRPPRLREDSICSRSRHKSSSRGPVGVAGSAPGVGVDVGASEEQRGGDAAAAAHSGKQERDLIVDFLSGWLDDIGMGVCCFYEGMD